MILYHVTNNRAARSILNRRFRDSSRFIGGVEVRGVWFSDRPWSGGSTHDLEDLHRTLSALTVRIDGRKVRRFEVVNEGCPYREWCIPASVLPRPRLVWAKGSAVADPALK